MIVASLKLPHKLSKKKVWIGVYGGHTSVVVVFNKKPIIDKEFPENGYCVHTNNKIIAGSFDLYEFNEWFGTNLAAFDINIMDIFECDLTAMWNDGVLIGLNTNADGCR
jgi:hypothetical protein